MNKPLVFNYKDYQDLREAYKKLLADNQRLLIDNRKLRKAKTDEIVYCEECEFGDPLNNSGEPLIYCTNDTMEGTIWKARDYCSYGRYDGGEDDV